MYHATGFSSPIGRLTIVARDEGLAAILWEDDDPARVPLGEARSDADHPVLVETMRQLDGYFAGTRTVFDLPLAPKGTDFQRQVWRALSRIPHGETRAYAEIAREIGRPAATRAVGAANGRNPISIVVPCHRVIGRDGSLTGFAGGLASKRWLLDHERGAPGLLG